MPRTGPYIHAGRIIRKARHAAHLTQAEVAAALNVSPVTVSRWERGTMRPKPELLEEVTATLTLPRDSLLRDFGYRSATVPVSHLDDGSLSSQALRLARELLRLSDRERRAVEAMVNVLTGD